MDNNTEYNDNKRITYHEQTDIQNILKLIMITRKSLTTNRPIFQIF